MSVSLSLTPRFDAATAASLARDYFGVDGVATPLPSERDQNFLVTTRRGDRVVLKIANAGESRALIEAQQAAMVHLGRQVPLVSRPRASSSGAMLVELDGVEAGRHLVWAVDYLPGAPLADVRHRSSALLRDLGRAIGVVTGAFADFENAAIHRDFYWDLAKAREQIAGLRPQVSDATLGACIDALVARFDEHTAPALDGLRRSAIHGDPNDHNVLVGDGDDVELRGQRITGLLDFGDMVYGWTVADLAIAIAYAMLDARDPLSTAAEIVRGCAGVWMPNDAELKAVFGLAALRLCVSACIAAAQRRERPDNEYLAVSQGAIGRTLPRLATIPFAFAEATMRVAAGVDPSAAASRVASYLAPQTATAAPVLGVDLRREPSLVLDLSVGSPLIAGDPRENDEPALTPRIAAAMREAGVRVSIGRWDEPRTLYQMPAFSGEASDDERRTIHIGLDLFADAGTPVFAPIAGVVEVTADNDAPQDYGPVIILRHETEDGTPFFTLYGHLSRESLAWVESGQRIAAGQKIATLGTPDVNGGWTPHLHLQVITDLMGLGVGFPGVGRPADRQVWRRVCPDPNLLVGVPASRFLRSAPSREQTLAERRRRFGANLSVGYREPLKIVRGWMQWLYDDEGRRYLDAYNNVPHVGHCHPRVVRAGQEQMRVLNTNTRYLSDLLNEYAERLTATLPDPLSVCWFVNSASEANELALRLARAYTGRRDTIVLEHAYHGNTTGLIDLSPYKHAGPGGSGTPEWVHVAPMPDDYRGPFKRGDPNAGAQYARTVADLVTRLAASGRGPAAFIAETCPSVGGQIVFPAGYLRDVYTSVRDAGGVCIADEVQTGLGRMGTSFWAFEDQRVVPDIVVAGKPLGNGHPIAAVITTPGIAAAFANGMEYFSTFGGNNVSCAIGLAVLDVLRDEQLQAHALRVGDAMLAGLRVLHDKYDLVGDVRGSGLFLGVELVRDRATLEPAGAEAAWVANRMRERGILLGTDGPYHNVVKIRPPMPFDERDADRLVETFDHVLRDLVEIHALPS